MMKEIDEALSNFKNGLFDEKKTKEKLEKYFYSQRYLINSYLKYDLHREKLNGTAEVIYGESKKAKQLFDILDILTKNSVEKILITRIHAKKWEELKQFYKSTPDPQQKNTIKINQKISFFYDETAQIAHTDLKKKLLLQKEIAIVSAGSSDISIARETEVSLHVFQRNCKTFYDVGVAGLGRLLGKMEEINQYQIIIAIAGMEASLPTVLSSLCRQPIIAVPTSVGHGASFKGMAALLSLLSSCSPGMAVVNIDGGFSAAALANKILHMPSIVKKEEKNQKS